MEIYHLHHIRSIHVSEDGTRKEKDNSNGQETFSFIPDVLIEIKGRQWSIREG